MRGLLERIRQRLPVKLKLAVVTAALTFAILLLFAGVIGVFTERRLYSSFEDDLRATAADLRDEVRVRTDALGDTRLDVSEDFYRVGSAGGAAVRVLDRQGQILGAAPLRQDLGGFFPSGVADAGEYRVATRELFNEQLPIEGGLDSTQTTSAVVGYVQYARPESNVRNTVARVRFFLTLGVLGGTALAFLAGFAVARRAMRPITGLTRAAREVARTRDPAGVELPKPAAHDEVADLADTLEEMLRELADARGETEAALARQRAFVADASHELRTPLTSILANLELLEAELQGEERDMARSALRSSHRMRRLVADLLLLARADAGRRAPRTAVDLSGVATEAAAEAGALAGERTVELDLPNPGEAMVEGTRDDLHRLALNLIENALIHTPVDARVRVRLARDNGGVTLEVSDSGSGIPPELRERVFERFARGGGDTTPATNGSGLGLAIVRAVAEAHGGRVTLDDAPDGGARFTVRLPATLASAPPPRAPVPSG